MKTKQHSAVNPRLTHTLKYKRKIENRLLAFTRCATALEGFEAETQIVALQAVAAMLGVTMAQQTK